MLFTAGNAPSLCTMLLGYVCIWAIVTCSVTSLTTLAPWSESSTQTVASSPTTVTGSLSDSLVNACTARASSSDIAYVSSYPYIHVYFTVSRPSSSMLNAAIAAMANASCLTTSYMNGGYATDSSSTTLVFQFSGFSSSQNFTTLERNAYLLYNVYRDTAGVASLWETNLYISKMVPASLVRCGSGYSTCVVDATDDSTSSSSVEKASSSRTTSAIVIGVAVAGTVAALGLVTGLCMLCRRGETAVLETITVTAGGGQQPQQEEEMRGVIRGAAVGGGDRIRIALPQEVDPNRVVVAATIAPSSANDPAIPGGATGNSAATVPGCDEEVMGVCFTDVAVNFESVYGPQITAERGGYLVSGEERRIAESNPSDGQHEDPQRPNSQTSTTSSQRREAWVDTAASGAPHDPPAT